MATTSIEERLRRLEDAHSIHAPARAEPGLICNASLLHTQQISELGIEYNNLEEAIHALEEANNDREERVRKLEQQLTNFKNDPAASTFLVDLDAQKAMLEYMARKNDMAIRMHELEKNSARSLSASTIGEIAQDLIQRLEGGDDLEPMVHVQLCAALGARDISPPPPAPASTSRGESAVNAATSDETRPQRAPGRRRKRKVDGPVEGEPLPKRMRRATIKASS
jgi:hypothetical protein